MNWTSELVRGLARLLQDSGIGKYIEEDDDESVFTQTDTAVVLKTLPPSPDRVIALNTYSPVDDLVLPHGSIMVQFRFRGRRGDVNDVDDLGDAVFDLLHGARYLDLIPGQPAISRAARKSSLQIGADGNGRMERTDNYELFGARMTGRRQH